MQSKHKVVEQQMVKTTKSGHKRRRIYLKTVRRNIWAIYVIRNKYSGEALLSGGPRSAFLPAPELYPSSSSSSPLTAGQTIE